jgi:hypothetical protein
VAGVTNVTLASGKVLATDPVTGKTSPEPVTAVIKGHKTEHLVRLTIRAVVHGRAHTGVIVATTGHPFYDLTRHAWVTAGHLHPGDHLDTLTRDTAVITAIRRQPPREATVYNLTVGTDHDYYVTAACAPVLVHNSGPSSDCEPLPTRTQNPSRLTNAQARDLAEHLGFRPTGQRIKNQIVFTDGKWYIVQDIDGHIGGTWKVARSIADLYGRATRYCTTDALLTCIGP